MKSKVYSIYDSAAKAFMQPFYQAGKGTAFRAFQDVVNTKDHPIHKHPKDYTLFELGEFDDETAGFVFHTAPERVVSAVEVLDDKPMVPLSVV